MMYFADLIRRNPKDKRIVDFRVFGSNLEGRQSKFALSELCTELRMISGPNSQRFKETPESLSFRGK